MMPHATASECHDVENGTSTSTRVKVTNVSATSPTMCTTRNAIASALR